MNIPETVNVQTRITLTVPGKEELGTFGKGTAALLLGIREYGSLNRAAKGIGMAYSKAWRLMNEVEAGFGVKLISREGAHGSNLTPEGNRLLDSYLTLKSETEEFASRRLAEILAG